MIQGETIMHPEYDRADRQRQTQQHAADESAKALGSDQMIVMVDLMMMVCVGSSV